MFVVEHILFTDEDEVTKSKCRYFTYERQILFKLLGIDFDS